MNEATADSKSRRLRRLHPTAHHSVVVMYCSRRVMSPSPVKSKQVLQSNMLAYCVAHISNGLF